MNLSESSCWKRELSDCRSSRPKSRRIPKILTNGTETGLVPPGDPAAPATQLPSLLRDPQERSGPGNIVLERVQHGVSWERAYRDYVCLVGLDPEAQNVRGTSLEKSETQ